MTYDFHARKTATSTPARAALRRVAWCLVPAMLLVNACSGDDDDDFDAPDAADSGRRDGSSDSGARGDASDARQADARNDVARDALPGDSARADAADARVDVARGDGALVDSGRDAGADARNDVNVDAAVVTPDTGRPDTGTPTADAGVDARPDAAVTAPDAASPEGGTPTVDASPAVDGGASSTDAAATSPDATGADAASVDAASVDAASVDAASADAASADAATTLQYSFENGIQGWTNTTTDPAAPPSAIGSVTTTTAQHDTGASSLAVTFTRSSTEDTDLALLSVDLPQGLAPGKVVTVRMFIPDNAIAWFDIYDTDASESGHWADSFFATDEQEPNTIHTGEWWTYRHPIPTVSVTGDEGDAATVPRVGPTQRLGFKFGALGPGTIYIDSITW